MIKRGKRDILGVMVDAVDYEAAVDSIVDAAQRRQPYAATALAVHGVMTGALDAQQRFRLNQLDLVVPDGQPVRWALNLLHATHLRDRVYGPELMLALCERCAREGIPIYLYGSSSDVLLNLSQRLRDRFPALTIAGSQPSKFRRITPAEKASIVNQIRTSGARLVFVGLGCPRQEVWAYEFREALSMPLIAVGAAFDFHAGTLKQAPRTLQNAGLEWAFRLSREPRRLWRRYALLNPLYIAMVAAQAARLMNLSRRAPVPPDRELNYG
ncbi:MAG TPA: WecB/TagA/CpsF family glycosyltransferase [Gemmatimonadaceae bacterium]|nr:WecB/TagA/CpsF family glycosyltransferase [Gemmatimonadaceae bacterium]